MNHDHGRIGRSLLPGLLLLATVLVYPLQAADHCHENGPDLLLFNGVIHRVDPPKAQAEAMAICGDTILAVGDSDSMQRLAGPNTKVVDLEGAFVMPGFNDAHLHFTNASAKNLGVDLIGVRSWGEMAAKVRRAVEQAPEGSWIFGRGWDENLWDEVRVPDRQALDRLSDNHPILLERVDGHSAIVNSLGLDLGGVRCEGEEFDQGLVVCDRFGNPTGWIKEGSADRVNALIPPPTQEQRIQAYTAVMEEMLAAGVTSVQDDSIRTINAGWAHYEALAAMRADDKLTVRVTNWLPFEAPLEQLQAWRESSSQDDRWLRTGLLKTNIDGSGGSLTAAMLEPYASAPDNAGVLLIDEERLVAMARERAEAGFQLAIHSIGDRANRVVLNTFERIADVPGSRALRHRVEHAQFLHDDDVARFAELGVIASAQPSHLLSDMRWAPRVLGEEREHEGYRWRSVLDAGGRLAFGTDYPVEVISPFRGLYAAVAREFEDGGPPGGWIPEEAISIEEAIRAYTLDSAYAEFEEGRKGSLSPGMLADMVVLDRDLTAIPPAELLQTRVLMTLVGGEVLYQASTEEQP